MQLFINFYKCGKCFWYRKPGWLWPLEYLSPKFVKTSIHIQKDSKWKGRLFSSHFTHFKSKFNKLFVTGWRQLFAFFQCQIISQQPLEHIGHNNDQMITSISSEEPCWFFLYPDWSTHFRYMSGSSFSENANDFLHPLHYFSFRNYMKTVGSSMNFTESQKNGLLLLK